MLDILFFLLSLGAGFIFGVIATVLVFAANNYLKSIQESLSIECNHSHEQYKKTQ